MGKYRSGRQAGSSFLPVLVFFVVLAFVITSGMAGFLLGKSTVGGTGNLVDTIVLSPEQNLARGEEEIAHFLVGRLLDPAGSPYADLTVQIREGRQKDVTDASGKFFLSDVRTGDHVLEVLDTAGDLLASAPVSLQFQKGNAPQAELSPGSHSFQLPSDVRMLEVALTLDAEHGALDFQEGTCFAVTSGGSIIDFNGKALELRNESFSVMPGGDIVSAEGYVVLPSKNTVVLPWGGVVQNEAVYTPGVIPGAAIDSSGSVSMDGGVTVKPDGVVEISGEDPDTPLSMGPTANVVVVVDGTAQELPELPQVYKPSPKPEATPPAESDPASRPEESAAAESSSAAGEETPEPTVPPQESSEQPVEKPVPEPSREPDRAPAKAPATPTPSPTPVPTPDPLTVGMTWTQESFIDLFSHRTKGAELGEEKVVQPNGTAEMVPVIAPGSAGYYNFNLKNDADYAIRFTLSISESTFHLPILYSVRDLQSNYLYQGGSKVNDDRSAITTDYILLPAKSQREYQLGWEWQYEDWLTPWIDDEYDTAAVQQKDRTYMVSLSIFAEQVYSSSPGHGDGLHYPGFPGY